MQLDLTHIFDTLLDAGVAGVVLAWLMVRVQTRIDGLQGRLDGIERSIDRLARAQLLELIARDGVAEPIRRQAHAALRDLQGERAVPEYEAFAKPPGFSGKDGC